MERQSNQATRARFIRALADAHHMASMSEWHRKAGVTRTFFWQTYNGQTIPNVRDAIKLARAAGTTVEMLFGHLADEKIERVE